MFQIQVNVDKVIREKKTFTIVKNAIVPTWVTGARSCAHCGFRVDEDGMNGLEIAIAAKTKEDGRTLYFHHDCFQKS